jgi:hypothetical protein
MSNRTHCTRQESRENLRQPYIRQTGGEPELFAVVTTGVVGEPEVEWARDGSKVGDRIGSEVGWKPSPRGVDLSCCRCTQHLRVTDP